MPPATTLGWVERSLTKGSEIRSIEPLRGSRWHVSHTLRIVGSSGEAYNLILRRWARPGWDAVDPDFDARREAAVLRLVEGLPMPTPHLVAADPDAQWCDVPTLLTTRLAGGPPRPPDDLKGYLQQLADALLFIHRIDCAPTDLPYYRSWSDMAAVQPAAWASESPLAAAEREVREELGVRLVLGRLLVVDWIPARPPKTEGSCSSLTAVRSNAVKQRPSSCLSGS